MKIFLSITLSIIVFFVSVTLYESLSGETIKEVVDMYPKRPTIHKYCADGQKILIIENECAITAVHIGVCEVAK